MAKNSTHSWDWPAIKAALERVGTSFAAIAAANRVSKQAVCKVKTRPSRRLQAAIARALKTKPATRPQEIWPDRYPDKQGG
jgi:lambda repressor-like predicted transcriptional regulator